MYTKKERQRYNEDRQMAREQDKTKKKFYKAWKAWEKLGFYFATSPNGVVKYICDKDGRKVVIEFSNEDRLKQAIAFIR